MTSKIDVICDHSQKNLRVVPMRVLDMTNLQMLYLEGNHIEHLPDDIFQKLVKLNWLDIRNNKLKEVPRGIAHHAFLEYLLLESNEIEALPNEVGLVPNLQVLQLSNNPIRYPTKDVIEKGVLSICSFLKTQHEQATRPSQALSEEVSTTSDTTSAQPVKKQTKRKISVRELLRKSAASTKLKMESMPIITIKSLSEQRKTNTKTSEATTLAPAKTAKKVHKITRHCSKLNIHSHYNSNKYVGVRTLRPNEERVTDQQLKSMWLGKLKELLNDQEKILQRDKNLKALNAWRLEKKPKKITADVKIEVPYDTDPEFDKMSSRKDLLVEVNKMIKKRKHIPKNVDVQALIDDVVSQLRTLRVPMPGERSPRTELELAEKDIQRIIELHKRVTSLQKKNSTMP